MCISLEYLKELFIFSFSYEDIVVAVLLPKNKYGYENLVAFFSKVLREVELMYEIIEKYAYGLIKAMK